MASNQPIANTKPAEPAPSFDRAVEDLIVAFPRFIQAGDDFASQHAHLIRNGQRGLDISHHLKPAAESLKRAGDDVKQAFRQMIEAVVKEQIAKLCA